MKFHQPSCNGTQAIVFTDTHTDTHTHTQTHTHTHRHTDKIVKPSFSDSGRCKTSRFVKISISIFFTITILPLYEKVKSTQHFPVMVESTQPVNVVLYILDDVLALAMSTLIFPTSMFTSDTARLYFPFAALGQNKGKLFLNFFFVIDDM